jgi:hypothetical protein
VLLLNECLLLLFISLSTQSGNISIHSRTQKTRWYPGSCYEGVSRSSRTGHLERELQMVELSASRGSCIAILWVSLVSFVAITLRVASQRVFISLPTQSVNFWILPHKYTGNLNTTNSISMPSSITIQRPSILYYLPWYPRLEPPATRSLLGELLTTSWGVQLERLQVQIFRALNLSDRQDTPREDSTFWPCCPFLDQPSITLSACHPNVTSDLQAFDIMSPVSFPPPQGWPWP